MPCLKYTTKIAAIAPHPIQSENTAAWHDVKMRIAASTIMD